MGPMPLPPCLEDRPESGRDWPPRKSGLPVSRPHIPCVLRQTVLENNGSEPLPSVGQEGGSGAGWFCLQVGHTDSLALAQGMAVWQQGQNSASLGCLPPACPGPYLFQAISRPRSTHCLQPLWPAAGLLSTVWLVASEMVLGRELPGRPRQIGWK